MVTQMAGDLQYLKDEVRRLRGKLDSISAGSTLLPSGSTVPIAVDGDLIVGTTLGWGRMPVVVPAGPALRNVVATDFGDTSPSYQAMFDATAPTTIVASAVAAPGTSLFAAHRDHTHGAPASFPAAAHNILSVTHGDTVAAVVVQGDLMVGNATPAWTRLAVTAPGINSLTVVGVANGEVAPTYKTLFDATAPTTIAAGDAAAAGTSLSASHRDHRHGAPASYPATAHSILSATHGDTVAAVVVRGDLMVGNATPAWARVAIGVAGSVFTSNGTDAAWSINPLIAGYARVGGSTAPVNTTAGDLTALRAAIGNSVILENATLQITSTFTPTATTSVLLMASTAAPNGSNVAVNALSGVLLVRPSAADTGDFRGLNYTVTHDSGAFNLNLMRGILVTATQAVAASTVTLMIAASITTAVSAGSVTTATVLRPAMTFAGGATVTTARFIDMVMNSFPTTLTTIQGINIPNLGNAAVTTAVGIDIAAQTGAVTTNVGIRNASNQRQSGYLSILGSAVVPTNVTDGDLTAIRGLFGTDVAMVAILTANQGTLGNEVFRMTSVAVNDHPIESVTQQRVTTVDATVTTLQTITIPVATTVKIVANVVARRIGGTGGTAEDGAAYTLVATAKNVAGVATLIGAVVQLTVQEDQAAWDATVDINAATMRIRVTGAVNNNVTWHTTTHYFSVGT